MSYPRLGQEESAGWFETIWNPVEKVLTAGADVFSQVYPAIKGQPSPGLLPGQQRPSTALYPYTAQSRQTMGTDWLLPALAVGGGVLLVMVMTRGKR